MTDRVLLPTVEADQRAAERSETYRQQEVIEEINRLLKKIDDCLTYIDEYIDENLKIEDEFWENSGMALKSLTEELLLKVNYMHNYIHQQIFK